MGTGEKRIRTETSCKLATRCADEKKGGNPKER